MTVTVSGSSGTDVVLSGLSAQNTLTFTSLDWDTAQAVTVTAGHDADASDDSVTLTHTAAGGQYGGVSADLAVTVVDDDAVIVFSPVPLRVIEGGAATYTVALAAAPSVDVTVTVSGSSGTDVVLSGLSAQNTLRFTSLDWDTAQTVTVTAGHDADASDDSVTLTHTAVGGQYGGVSADLAVTVVDDDAVIVFVPTSVTVAEGEAATYTVALAAAPSVDVTVTVSGFSGTDVVLSGLSAQNTLRFTSLDWDAAQTVTVTAGHDADASDDSVTLAHTAAGGGYGGVSADLAVTVTDDDAPDGFASDDDAPDLVLGGTSITVPEGEAASYTVALGAPPSVDVTVTVSGHSGTDVALSGLSAQNTLTFTSLDWDTAQTVTVTAGQDADASDDSVTLTHTAAGGEYDGVSAELAVTVADDDDEVSRQTMCDDVWCATVVLKWHRDLIAVPYIACSIPSSCPGSSRTSTSFTLDGMDYTIGSIAAVRDIRPGSHAWSRFRFGIWTRDPVTGHSVGPSAEQIASWTLHINDMQLALSEATSVVGGTDFVWRGEEFLDFEDGTILALRIVHTP